MRFLPACVDEGAHAKGSSLIEDGASPGTGDSGETSTGPVECPDEPAPDVVDLRVANVGAAPLAIDETVTLHARATGR